MLKIVECTKSFHPVHDNYGKHLMRPEVNNRYSSFWIPRHSIFELLNKFKKGKSKTKTIGNYNWYANANTEKIKKQVNALFLFYFIFLLI